MLLTVLGGCLKARLGKGITINAKEKSASGLDRFMPNACSIFCHKRRSLAKLSLLPSQSGGGECANELCSLSAFVVGADCGSHYHSGKSKNFQAKLRSSKAYRVTRQQFVPNQFVVTLHRGLIITNMKFNLTFSRN